MSIGTQILANGIELDSVLAEQGFVFLEALYQVLLLQSPFTATRRLGRNNTALDTGLDTIGTWLILVTADFALLTKHTAGATGQFNRGRIMGKRLGLLGMRLLMRLQMWVWVLLMMPIGRLGWVETRSWRQSACHDLLV